LKIRFKCGIFKPLVFNNLYYLDIFSCRDCYLFAARKLSFRRALTIFSHGEKIAFVVRKRHFSVLITIFRHHQSTQTLHLKVSIDLIDEFWPEHAEAVIAFDDESN